MLKETLRWYGPDDPVSLTDIRQCGCTGVMTSLHHIAYGEAWPRQEIAARKQLIEQAGLEWVAVESVPVSEAIKTRSGDFRRHIENYRETIRSLGAEGIPTVIYNFMPVLDWIRTDIAYRLEDGSECLRFDPVHFAAFEIHLLGRAGAEADYSRDQLDRARKFFAGLDAGEREAFQRTIIDVFPGVSLGLSLGDVRAMLATYDGIDAGRLREHLRLFLEEVVPVCEEAGVRLAIHPDDPPFPVLGLPRIVSCEEDVAAICAMVDSPANGLCFCSGSFSVRADNDLPGMVERWGQRIHAFHLRSTRREADGSFYEADHLGGSVDMFAVVRAALREIRRRRDEGMDDREIAFRPDHGHTMLDDLGKARPKNPGYSCIGRMRGLAEIRGLQLGIERMSDPQKR